MRNVAKSAAQHARRPDKALPIGDSPLPSFAWPFDILTATAYGYRLLLSLLWFIQFML